MRSSAMREPLLTICDIVGLINEFEDLSNRVLGAQAKATFDLESKLIRDLIYFL